MKHNTYINGLALQSYLVPSRKVGVADKQVRLYISRRAIDHERDMSMGDLRILRLNVNGIDAKRSGAPLDARDDTKLAAFSKEVATLLTGPYSVARLTYVN